MELFNTRRITNIGVMALIYVVISLICSPFAYQDLQFRISEMFILLCLFNKDYIISFTLGCFIVNLWSPLGYIDVVFGTTATLISAILIYRSRSRINMFLASLIPVIINGLVVAGELTHVEHTVYWKNACMVALGEFACISIAGVIVVNALKKNKRAMKLITAGLDIRQ